MAVAAIGAREIGHKFGAQRLFHFLQDFFLHRFHAQHAIDDFESEVLWQYAKYAGGVVGFYF